MIKVPRKLLELKLTRGGIIWLSYFNCITEIGFHYLVGHYAWKNREIEDLSNHYMKMPENLGRLQNYD